VLPKSACYLAVGTKVIFSNTQVEDDRCSCPFESHHISPNVTPSMQDIQPSIPTHPIPSYFTQPRILSTLYHLHPYLYPCAPPFKPKNHPTSPSSRDRPRTHLHKACTAWHSFRQLPCHRASSQSLIPPQPFPPRQSATSYEPHFRPSYEQLEAYLSHRVWYRGYDMYMKIHPIFSLALVLILRLGN
jgi:hypothetical protein